MFNLIMYFFGIKIFSFDLNDRYYLTITRLRQFLTDNIKLGRCYTVGLKLENRKHFYLYSYTAHTNICFYKKEDVDIYIRDFFSDIAKTSVNHRIEVIKVYRDKCSKVDIFFFTGGTKLFYHMLLNILSGFTYNIMISGIISFFLALLPLAFIIAFSGLELAIAFIQAQVFIVLTCSYIKDALDLH